MELAVEYDSQNFRSGGLDFRQFIRLGGILYGYRGVELMHHKFAVIDEAVVMTGSFNWTNNSNAENVLVMRDAGLAGAYLEEFSRIKALSERVLKVRRERLKPFAVYPIFENTRFRREDVRLRLSLGAGVWKVPAGYFGPEHSVAWQSVCMCFDPEGVLLPYWRSEAGFDNQRMRAYLQIAGLPVGVLQQLRAPLLRIRKGDFIIVAQEHILALGMIQSDPQPSRNAGFGGEREIQWLRIMELPMHTKSKAIQSITCFRGNRMAFVDSFYELSP